MWRGEVFRLWHTSMGRSGAGVRRYHARLGMTPVHYLFTIHIATPLGNLVSHFSVVPIHALCCQTEVRHGLSPVAGMLLGIVPSVSRQATFRG
jgi:hypothetical protein